MRLKLMKRGEFEKIEVGETAFWVRKLFGDENDALIIEHTKDGIIDFEGLAKARWKYFLGDEGRPTGKPGWENLCDANGEDLTYDASKLDHVLAGLSEDMKLLIVKRAMRQSVENARQEKNS